MDKKPSPNTLRVKKLPFVIKNGQKMTILKSNITPNVRVTSLYREDVIHDTTDVYFLKGEYQRMTLVNRTNIVTKCNKTIAKYFSTNGAVVEKTSDNVTEVIGQEQYKTVFTALCSIIDQELKIRSILALLTSKQLPVNKSIVKEVATKDCQTNETRIGNLKTKPRRRIRKKTGPYIVQDFKLPETKKPRRIVVNIPNLKKECDESSKISSSEHCSVISENSNSFKNFYVDENASKSVTHVTTFSDDNLMKERMSLKTESLTDLGHLNDDYSNDSTGLRSVLSDTPTLLESNIDLLNVSTTFLNDIDQHTSQKLYSINMFGRKVCVPFKPESLFHMASQQNLLSLDQRRRNELKYIQMLYDYHNCLTVDEDGNLPLHLAVLNNDLELLDRQCVVLNIKGSSLDIPANGLTALKLSLYQEPPVPELTSSLIRHGADPLLGDLSNRTSVHIAAERDADLLRVVLQTTRDNARKILTENEDLWKPVMMSQPDDELAQTLMMHMCSMFDKQGYSPLMLACMLGRYENIRVLLEQAPNTVNLKMPTSGNTALYLAVAAACNSSSERGNKSKVVDNFRQTIEILLDCGADPTIDNHSGTNVNTLLTEFNCAELSVLVANNLTQKNFSKHFVPDSTKDFDKLMLVMDKEGNVECKALENEKRKKSDSVVKKKKKTTDKKNKPLIIKNILVKSPKTDNTGPKVNASAGKSGSDRILVDSSTKSTKVMDLQQILITAKPQRNTEKTENEIIKILTSATVSTQVNKRKLTDTPNILKKHSKKGK